MRFTTIIIIGIISLGVGFAIGYIESWFKSQTIKGMQADIEELKLRVKK